jgi:hypothetical protein
VREPDAKRGSVEQEVRTCAVCGTKFSAASDSDFCPVCILRGAARGQSAAATVTNLADGSEHRSEEGEPTSPVQHFENYELMLDEEGRPIELGRGAMGITYKALDVDLRCAVTLKVITERYLDDQSARLRFLREARAAASIRLRRQQTEAWKECNRRLFYHYRALAPQLPDNFREMEPLFLAVICGCKGGIFPLNSRNVNFMQRLSK